MMNSENRKPRFHYAILVLSLSAVVYFSLMLWFVSPAYLDFGDGNYLYISWRMTQGIVIYKDILSPQPPLHLFLGFILLKLGNLINNPLFIVRIFTILLRISHAFLIYLVCRKIWHNSDKNIGAVAGMIYLFLPIGFWWSRGFETEPVEIVWLLLTLFFFLKFNTKGMIYAGIFSALGILTNMTFAPYFCFNLLYLLFTESKTQKREPINREKKINQRLKMLIAKFKLRNYQLLFAYLIPSTAILGLVTLFMSWYTNGQFLQNVIFDQVGTYPKENTFLYMFGKMKWICRIIFALEGPLIFASLIGLFFFWQNSRMHKVDDNNKTAYHLPLTADYLYVLLYMLATLGSFIFATKGGTVDYIFTLGEPAVAIFSAFVIILLIQNISSYLKPILSWSIGVILLLILSYPGLKQDILTLQGTNYELDAAAVNQVVASIQKYSQPEDLIFAPPYFAFLAERKIVGEFSEQFVWFMKYINYIRYREGNPKTMLAIAQMANLIETKKVKYIMLNINPNRGQQTGQIYPIRKAVDENYYPVGEIRMRNETLTVFLPR